MTDHLDLLQEAVGLYSKVLEQILAIEEALADFQAPKIEQLARELDLSMKEARAIDQKIEACSFGQGDVKVSELVSKRRQLMEQILSKNRLLEPRLLGIRALQLNEIKQIKQGRQTASGYAQQLGSKTGRVINSSN